ncbi:MAG: AAA family ATPase [Armatimonadetes bacterium]|nr:AAA family ATPase [Armatimonadota bacterium]
MLTYLRLQNFRSCIDTEWHLEPVTLLIGTNNAGKSNLCRALRFLSAPVARFGISLDDAARSAGLPPSEIAHRLMPAGPIGLEAHWQSREDAEVSSYRYHLVFQSHEPTALSGNILTIAGERLTEDAGGHVEDLINRSAASQGRNPGQTCLGEVGHCEFPTAAIANWRYYNLANCDLRSHQQATYDAYLRDDGSNLASCLFALKNEDSRNFGLLIDLVREVEPSLHTFNFIRPRPEELWLEVEDSNGARYGLESLSDGTLNYLAMCYIALQGQLTTHRDTPAPRLVILEEPENRLYVRHLRRLLEVIREGAQKQQTIITTHNPYLIDLFEDHLEEVRLVKRGRLGLEEGTEVVKPDEALLRERLEDFSLGELHFREFLQ